MITGQIPLPGNPLDSFGKSFNGMDQFFQQLKAHQLAKQQFAEQLRQHQVAEQLAKASAGRAQAASGRNASLFDEKMKGLKSQNAIRDWMMQGLQQGGNANETSAQQMPSSMPSFGMGQDEQRPAGNVPNINEAAMSPLNAFRQAQSSWNQEVIPGSGITRGDLMRKEMKLPGRKSEKSLYNPVEHDKAYQNVMALEKLRQDYPDVNGQPSPQVQRFKEQQDLQKRNDESLTAQRERRATGLKTGETYIKDKTGENIGINRDYSPAEKKEEKGRIFFSEVYPGILEATSYYSGEGSLRRFENDARNYSFDKAAQKRIDDYLAAKKLLPASLVKENATVGGANTNQVYNRLVASLDASDLPKTAEEIISAYQLPKEANLRSGKIFNENLLKATDKSKNIPARHSEYFDEKKEGYMLDPKTNKIKKYLVSPKNWSAFVEKGGY